MVFLSAGCAKQAVKIKNLLTDCINMSTSAQIHRSARTMPITGWQPSQLHETRASRPWGTGQADAVLCTWAVDSVASAFEGCGLRRRWKEQDSTEGTVTLTLHPLISQPLLPAPVRNRTRHRTPLHPAVGDPAASQRSGAEQ